MRVGACCLLVVSSVLIMATSTGQSLESSGPVTPSKVSNAIVIDTPLSKGSSTHQSYSTRHNQEDFLPYLLEDLKNKRYVEFDLFLTEILKAPPDAAKMAEIWIKSTKKNTIEEDMHQYCLKVEREPDRYNTFVVLANNVLNCLDPTRELCFCRNDPTIVRGGCAALRKPDVVGVRVDAFDVGERANVDNLKEKGPKKDDAFTWPELLGFWEFKVVEYELGLAEREGEKGAPKGMVTQCFTRSFSSYFKQTIRCRQHIRAEQLNESRIGHKCRRPVKGYG